MKHIDDIHKRVKPRFAQTRITKFTAGAGAVKDEADSIEKAAHKLRQSYLISTSGIASPTLKKGFRKAYVLVPFTLIVLIFGAYFGARFVSFANSVSTSSEGFYKSIGNNIGATFGNVVPGLKRLDNTKLAESIKNQKRINILLLGYGGVGHQGSYLTDTILLLSLDTKDNKATFVPVPRDLWVEVPTDGYDGFDSKINAAYAIGMDDKNYPSKLPQFKGADGAGNLAKYEVSSVLGVPIDYYISVDFFAFKKIVDTLGGVQIDVQKSFTDYSYPTGGSNVDAPLCVSEDLPDSLIKDCRYKKLHFDAGLQNMSGDRALAFVRSRHASGAEGSDFARSRRQQLLLSAIEQKAISVGAVTKVFSLMDAVQGHFRTDLALAEIKDLADYLSGINLSVADHISLTDGELLTSTYSADGQWILVPVSAGVDKDLQWSEIQKIIKEKLK